MDYYVCAIKPLIDSLKLEWPSGLVQVRENVSVDQYLIVNESCCEGRVGNANDVGTYPQEVTISDIQTLVNHLFIAGPANAPLKDCL